MADYDPAYQSGAWDENGEYEEAEGNEQEHIQQHSTHEDQAEYSVDPSQRHAPGDPPSSDGDTDDAGDYDPASVTVGAALQPVADPVPLRPSPQNAAKKKPRAAGGFLVGDSDSEDDEAPVPASGGHAPGAASHSSVPRSPLQHTITAKQSTIIPPAVDSATQLNVATDAPDDRPGNGFAPQAPVDRITQLETRVRDDPRGAMDAWLALIAEYRARNDSEQSRQIYERFLAVFPQAVSETLQAGNTQI